MADTVSGYIVRSHTNVSAAEYAGYPVCLVQEKGIISTKHVVNTSHKSNEKGFKNLVCRACKMHLTVPYMTSTHSKPATGLKIEISNTPNNWS